MSLEVNAPVVAEVLAQLRAAVDRTQRIMIAREPKNIVLERVEVTLQTVAVEDTNVGIKFKIPFLSEDDEGGAGYGSSQTRTHTHTVTLVPSDKVIYKLHDEEPTVADTLVQALLDTREIAQDAGLGSYPFALQSSTFEVKFGVTKDHSLSVVLADTAYSRETVQTIKITLKNTDLPDDA